MVIPGRLPRSLALHLAAALLLALPGLLSPLTGGMLASFLPLPFASLTRTHGAGWGCLLALLFGAAFAMVTGPLPAAHLVMLQAGSGILIGWLAARRRPLLEQMLVAAGVPLLIAALLSIPPVPGLLGPDWPTLTGQIDQGMRLWRELAIGNGAAGIDVGGMIAFVEPVFPGFNVVGMMLNTLLCSILAGFGPLAGRDADRPLLRSWRLPDWLTWCFILNGFLLLRGMTAGRGIPASVMVVLLFLFLVQGFAVAVHRADRWGLGIVPRILFGMLLIIQPVGLGMLAALMLLGLVDFKFDFRREETPSLPPA